MNCRPAPSDRATTGTADDGAGVCVGYPVPGLVVKVIEISDAPVANWSEALELPAGEIGEIAVKAAHASRSYFNLPAATALAKIEELQGKFESTAKQAESERNVNRYVDKIKKGEPVKNPDKLITATMGA